MSLELGNRRWFCPKGHSFDVASSGYINLLQPQDRRSRQAGDSNEARLARVAMHERGITRPFVAMAKQMLQLRAGGALLDVGCGDGFYLAQLRDAETYPAGIDVSIPAIQSAARRYPECFWIVGNADRFIPFADRTFDAVVSLTARRNPTEFQRILRPDGVLLVAVPAPKDLIELRGHSRDRRPALEEELSDCFSLVQHERATTTAEMSEKEIEQIFQAIYRPMQQRKFAAQSITFSLDFLLFRARA